MCFTYRAALQFELQVNHVSSKLFIFLRQNCCHNSLSFSVLKRQALTLKTQKLKKTGFCALMDQLNFGKEANFTRSIAKKCLVESIETDGFLNYVSALDLAKCNIQAIILILVPLVSWKYLGRFWSQSGLY